MAKKNGPIGSTTSSGHASKISTLLRTSDKDVDPVLASLFQSSAGPIAPPKRKLVSSINATDGQEDDEESVSSESSESIDQSDEEIDSSSHPSQAKSDHAITQEEVSVKPLPKKKRKRAEVEDDLEDRYMKRLADEEAREQKSLKRSKAKGSRNGTNISTDEELSASPSANDDADSESDVPEQSDIEMAQSQNDHKVPQHESLSKTNENPDIEKASRTVFLGNVSTQAILSKSGKKEFLRHLASFFPSLPSTDTPHKVESLRFRSTAYAHKLPKKTSFVRKELMDTTTKSTNAYAVYSNQLAAREAVKQLNGTVVLERHLRVDQVAHPAKVEHRRCVFVGNLAFVDDESKQNDEGSDGEEKPKKKKTRPPADVEEGLWRQFAKAGTVESVRVIRDQQTRIGKGFAYVQFTDENAVEAALLFNDKAYPPLLPRKLRVTRAKSFKRNAPNRPTSRKANGSTDRTLQGRAGKLLGRAGAAQMRNPGKWGAKKERRDSKGDDGAAVVFEGHRAQSSEGKKGLKFGGAKKKGKPGGRSAKRASAWKKANKK